MARKKDHSKIPTSGFKHLNTTIDLMAQGKAIKVNPVDAEITIQESANLLTVSRPYIVKLLEEGEIPFHKVGSHHRIKLKDFLAYKKEMEKEREEDLIELIRISQELNMGTG